jgi:hypothetical protein
MATLTANALPAAPSQAQAEGWPVRGLGKDDPQFKPLLDAHFAGYDSMPAFNALMPHTIIFQNTTARHVRGLAIDWQIPMKNGNTHSHTFHYSVQSRKRLDTRAGFSREGRDLSGRRTILRAGDYFIVTPLFVCSSFSFNTLREKGKLNNLAGQLLSSRREIAKHLLHTPDGMSSKATIRSIVHPHAQLVTAASDQQDVSLQRHFFSRSRAEQDEAASILKLLKQGYQRPEISKVLQTHIQRAIPKVQPGHPRIYAKTRQKYARHLLKVVNRHNLPVAQTMLEAIVNVPAARVQVSAVNHKV